MEQLHEREDWKVHDEEGGLVTSLPLLFEKRVVEVLLLLKEIVNEPQEYSQPEVNQELRHCAKTHFEDLLNVGAEKQEKDCVLVCLFSFLFFCCCCCCCCFYSEFYEVYP